ncbi:hypothetical protein As57867_017190, partial [Aphanomyces stellatus]
MQSSGFFGMTNQTIFDPISGLPPNGSTWVQAILAHAWVSVVDEAALWTSHGLTQWRTQLQNLREPQLDQSISIVNALGLAQTMKINAIPLHVRGGNEWTTSYAYSGFWNDLTWAEMGSFGLILNTKTSLNYMGFSWDLDQNVGYDVTPVLTLTRLAIGPYDSIDLWLVPPPLPLLELLVAFQDTLLVGLEASGQTIPFLTITTTNVDAAPPDWTNGNLTFFGGNPTCVYGDGLPFVQDSFGFYDACGSQTPLLIHLDATSVLFAHLATNATSPCDLVATPALAFACGIMVKATMTIFWHENVAPLVMPRIEPLITPASTSTLPLHISMMQFAATPNDTLVTLVADMLTSSTWSFFGWVTMYDWLLGHREVYAFEGDVATVTLMTRRHDYVQYQANPLELPQAACHYILGVSLYVSTLLFFLMCLLFVYAASVHFHVANVIHINRVAAIVWGGRPFLFVRGMTALVLLSTSPIQFVVGSSGVARFSSSPRPLLDTLILASEATWAAYVLQDVLLPLTSDVAAVSAPFGTALSWLTIVIFDMTAPYRATATIDRQCTVLQVGLALDCHAGTVTIGSFGRLQTLVGIGVGCAAVAYIIVRVAKQHAPATSTTPRSNPHFAIPAPSEAFFHMTSDEWHLDSVACAMSGVLPLRHLIFDVKLWVVTTRDKYDRGHTFAPAPSTATMLALSPVSDPAFSLAMPSHRGMRMHLVTLAGFLYIGCTVAVSYTFVGLSKSTMANDFWWASFNTTGAQSYLVNWFNTQLQFIPTNSTTTYTLALDSPQHTDMMYLYNLTTPPSLSASSLYVTEIQVNTLANVIASLRKMDGCALPWIFTAYCYVDFDHTFEMANSAARQAKCQQQPLVADGASYLESILRNADWPALTTCWGAALASAILNDVTMTTIGQTWLTQTQAAAASNLQPMAQVEVEVVYWTRRGIVTFTPQWQNFKRVGILETFAIENALGVAYPLTLKRSNGTFQIDRETSFKLYWGFANDLFVVATNGTTPLSGKSLVRASPRFAFANTTLQYVLVANGTLPTPFGPGFSVVQSTLGPFGSISVYRVACPSAVRAWYAAVDTLLRTVLTTNVALQSQFQAIAGQ